MSTNRKAAQLDVQDRRPSSAQPAPSLMIDSPNDQRQQPLQQQDDVEHRGPASGEVNRLQPLLEQALRESLREMAVSASESSSTFGSSQSIDCIVRRVAARVMSESNGDDASDPEKAGFGKLERDRAQPLLEDLQTTPWLLWREQSEAESAFAFARRGSYHVPMVAMTPPPHGGDSLPPGSSHSSEKDGDADSSPEDVAAAQGRAAQAWVASALLKTPLAGKGHAVGGDSETPLVVTEGLTVQTSSDQHLMMKWQGTGRPGIVLLIAKPGDALVMATLQDMAAWLSSQGIVCVLEHKLLADQPALKTNLGNVRTFSKGDDLEKHIDLVITIGGDGTLTWAVSHFNGAMPPVLSFAAGSLGFLTPFPLDGWVRTLTRVFGRMTAPGPVPLVCRMRLKVVVRRRASGSPQSENQQKRVPLTAIETTGVLALNEVLVHRGNFGALAKLDVGVDGQKVTVLQGDGVILATPTGSTAYSLAAGGSMAHPGVPAILLTPVSPHSLSFRPAVLPDSAVVSLTVPLTARHGAALSVDGKDLCFLKLGDTVEVSCSSHPVPTICRTTGTADWFNSVHNALQWNGRIEQK